MPVHTCEGSRESFHPFRVRQPVKDSRPTKRADDLSPRFSRVVHRPLPRVVPADAGGAGLGRAVHPGLFHRDLRANIAYARPDADDREVERAARRAHTHGFISRLPAAYAPLVGERGIKLSGGQRQRIGIARALLKDAPILILDEATSSLDSRTEALIQDALRELRQGKTVLAIAHRLSTLKDMDRIVVLDHGRVAESGTHDQLLADPDSRYARLWAAQIDACDAKRMLDADGASPSALTPPTRRHIALRLDADVIDFFRDTGPCYQRRINAVLRAYTQRHAKSG